MENLPRDVLVEIIFQFLPASSQAAFRFVCKRFHQSVLNITPAVDTRKVLLEACEDERLGKSLAAWLIEYLKYPVSTHILSSLGSGIIYIWG